MTDQGRHAGDRAAGETIRNYFDLVAWRKSRQMVKTVYELTRTLPHDEMYGLTSQMRRAAVSVPSNIAEGYGRGTRKDYVHFLRTARGSLYELQTQLLLAQDLAYITATAAQSAMDRLSECSKVIAGLIKSLAQPQASDPDA